MAIKDSLSKCDYTNPYDIRNYPIKKQGVEPSHKAKSFTKDVLEISQDNVKKDAMKYLDSAASRIPSGLYVVVCKLGKYTFLAMALPPYFALYTFPKWLFVRLIPSMATTITQPIFKLMKMVQKAVETTVHAVWNPIMRFFDRANKGFKRVGQRAAEMQKGLKALMQKAMSLIKNPFQNPFQGIAAFLKKMQEFNPRNALERFGKALIRPVQTLMSQITNVVQTVKEKPFAWVGSIRESMSNRIITLVQNLKNTLASSTQMANRMTLWLGRAANIPFQLIGKGFTSMMKGLKAYAHPFAAVAKGVAMIAQRIKQAFAQMFKPARRFGEALSKQSQEFLSKGKAFAAAVWEKIYSHLPKRVQRFLDENPWMRLLRKLFAAIFRLIAAPFKLIYRLLIQLKTAVNQIPKVIAYCQPKIVAGFRWLDKWVVLGIKNIRQAFVFVLRHIVYWSLVVIILLCHTVAFAFRLLDAVTGHMIKPKAT